MQRTVLFDKKGLTLVEVMIALLLFLLVSLAMMQSALVSIGANTSNYLRDEAISVADRMMNQVRSFASTDDPDRGFGKLVTDSGLFPAQIKRSVRNIAGDFNFDTKMNVVDIDGNTKQVTIEVDYYWPQTAVKDPANKHTHTITSIVRRPS